MQAADIQKWLKEYVPPPQILYSHREPSKLLLAEAGKEAVL